MHHTRINCLITRDIQNNFVELNATRDETVDTRVKHFPEQPSSPDGNHTLPLYKKSRDQKIKAQRREETRGEV